MTRAMPGACGSRILSATVALLTLVPGAAQAVELKLLDRPLQLNITEYGDTAYHTGNGSIALPGKGGYDPTGAGYLDWLNRFQLDASWGDFTAMLRLDSDLFVRAPQAAPGDKYVQNLLADRFANRLDLEKVSLGYTARYVEVTLGDSY